MRTKQGTITSAKMKDTVTVTVHRLVFHPMYKKRFRVSKKFLADCKGMDLWLGDEVVITECRPISKRKHFRVTEVVKHAPRVSEMQVETDVAAASQRKAEVEQSSASSK
jgi:small subunit ribosomal protein S17